MEIFSQNFTVILNASMAEVVLDVNTSIQDALEQNLRQHHDLTFCDAFFWIVICVHLPCSSRKYLPRVRITFRHVGLVKVKRAA